MKLLLYCCKEKPYLYKEITEWATNPISYGLYTRTMGINTYLNGKIVAECDFEVEEIKKKCVDVFKYCYITDTLNEFELMYKTQLDGNTTNNYLKGKNGYAIHIKNLHIFDEPYELGKTLIYNFNTQYIVEKAPQNMMKVYNRAGECHILISIKPQWMCLILNRIKDVEVRKVVLKEMLENE